MTHRTYWGLAALSILLGTAFVFIMLRNQAEIRELKRQLVEPEKLRESGINPPTGVNKFNTRPEDIIRQNYENKPNDGNEYVWHGDHWHRVPDPDRTRFEDMDFSSVKSSRADFFKSDLPDKLPAEFPTDEEIQQMSYADLGHLIKLYRKAALELDKTDYEAGTRLYNRTSKLVKRQREIGDELSAKVMERHNAFVKTLPIEIPATEDSTGVIIEVGEFPKEGGKQ